MSDETSAMKIAALRRRAQEIIAGRASIGVEDSAADLHLRHELEVHQVELELQNQQLREVQAELETYLDYYTDLFDFAPIGYVALSALGAVTDINLTAAALFAQERAMLKGADFRTLIWPADWPLWQAHVDALLQAERGQNLPIELLLLRGEAEPFVAQLDCARANARGGDLRIRVALSDISERKRLQLMLQRAQKGEALGTLAGGVAHDFNNILAGLLLFANLLKDDLPADSPQRHFVNRIIAGGERGKALVDQILAYARNDKLDRQAMDLRDLVVAMGKYLTTTLPSTSRLAIEIGDQPLIAAVNAEQINQVLVNLCVNASDALAGQQGDIRVGLASATGGALSDQLRQDAPQPGALVIGSIDRTATYAVLQVSDTGSGIDSESLGKIFDPFFTTKELLGGIGLGLAIVHGIVTAHGGAYKVRTSPQGTSIDICLRLAPTAEIKGQPPTAAH